MAGRKKKILVVEDETALREAYADVLEERGYDPETAADGDAALAHLSSKPAPDLIVLDLKLPKTDGWAVHVWLKNHAQLKSIPVVIVSGVDIDSALRDKMNREAPYWLEKPVTPKQLVAAIERHL